MYPHEEYDARSELNDPEFEKNCYLDSFNGRFRDDSLRKRQGTFSAVLVNGLVWVLRQPHGRAPLRGSPDRFALISEVAIAMHGAVASAASAIAAATAAIRRRRARARRRDSLTRVAGWLHMA